MRPRRPPARKVRFREDLFTPFHTAPGVEVEQYGVPFVVLERQVRERLQNLGIPVDARMVTAVTMKVIPDVLVQLRARGKVNVHKLGLRNHYDQILRSEDGDAPIEVEPR